MDKFRHHVNSEKSFAFKVSAFGKKLTSPEQIQRMSVFSPLFSKTDRVDIQSPNTTLVILEVRNPRTTSLVILGFWLPVI